MMSHSAHDNSSRAILKHFEDAASDVTPGLEFPGHSEVYEHEANLEPTPGLLDCFNEGVGEISLDIIGKGRCNLQGHPDSEGCHS